MFKFEKDLIKPDYNREPCYVGGETHKAIFSWNCDNCGRSVELKLSEIRRGYGWLEDWSTNEIEVVKDHFKLNKVGESHDGGWTYLIKPVCDSCGRKFILYAGVSEDRNSWYGVYIQGLVSINSA